MKKNYLFREIAERVEKAQIEKPLNLGVGDVTLPLIDACAAALKNAAEELRQPDCFKGYGPAQGYLFLREKIAENDYQSQIDPDEIFIGSSAKSDAVKIESLFSPEENVALTDPAYPVYEAAAHLSGRDIHFLPSSPETGFLPHPPECKCSLIYLCSPNNPTGVAYSRETLKLWVDYAKKHNSIIIFDTAYAAFIQSDAPKSIYEIEGAKEVAIEIGSFSKRAGFTSLLCSYMVIPKQLIRDGSSLNSLWKQKINASYNGTSYPVQKAAEATFTVDGKAQLAEQIKRYQNRTKLLREGLLALGFTVYGGIDAPFVFCKTPETMSSWQFFDLLLERCSIIAVPGSGFGKSGEGFIRFSGFASEETIFQALQRLDAICATC